MAKIVITQDLNLSDEQLQRLDALGELKAYDDVPATDDEWVRRVEGFDVISSGQFGLRTRYKDLNNKFISLSYVGWGFLDPAILRKNHLTVANAPGSNKAAVAEWIVAMTINLMRDLPSIINTVSDTYAGLPPKCTGLFESKVVILGAGNIGTMAGQVLTALGAKVSFYGRNDDLSQLIIGASVVINTLSLNDSNAGMLDKAFFEGLERGTYFISITGAEVFDQKALLKALDDGVLAGAAIDCGSVQVGDGSDSYFVALARHPKVMATPHIAYNTTASGRVGNDMMIANIEAWLSGRPINLVGLDVD